MADPVEPPKTQRDIRQRVKTNSEDIGFYGAAWAQGSMLDAEFLDKLQKNAADIEADLAAYPDAEP